RFLLTAPLSVEHPAALECALYGDGVKDVAFTVFDAEKAYERAIRNGAQSAAEPRTVRDEHGSITTASIKTYGRCIHTFVSRTGAYDLVNVKKGGTFAPGFRAIEGLAVNDYNRANPCG